jgi:phytoene dehydrogenase-like protein
VSKIGVKGREATGVELAGGEKIRAGLVVTNAGPKRTHKLLGSHTPEWFIRKEKTFLSAFGISYSVASDEPLLDHDSIEVPMDYDHISGYVQVSNLDASLAPPGKHYLLAAQMVTDQERGIADAINGGIRDLLDLFPQIDRTNLFNVSSFHRDWAGAPTGQRMGQSGPDRYPIKMDPFRNLYMVSHDSQGWGFSGDLIGHAAWNFKQMI